MRALSASEWLGVWEQGLAEPPIQWALTLLAAACPETPPAVLARLSIGQRDARLLTLREWAFGSQLAAVATCPACGERLDVALDLAGLRVAPSPAEGEGANQAEPFALSTAGYDVQFRLPNSLDLAAISGSEDAGRARQRLLESCLVSVRHEGRDAPLDELPANVALTVSERMAQADPQADVVLALQCPACAHQWQTMFDILSFLQSELDAWARRVLREVHVLASAYGWREADILALSPWRRQCYLEMVQA